VEYGEEFQRAFAQAVEDHDRAVRARGAVIWVGGEPTYTDRFSEQPAWLFEALGADKEARAQRLLMGLYQPGLAVLRTVGRQYPGESRPRWSIGLYGRRDGWPAWEGPSDPMVQPECAATDLSAVRHFWEQLTQGLQDMGRAVSFVCLGETGLRIVFRRDGTMASVDQEQRPELTRGSVHHQVIPGSGLRDALAVEGDWLLAIGMWELESGNVAVVELPAVDKVSDFLALLGVIGHAALAACLPGLVFRGYPPPVDPTVSWDTLTPDPAVIEVNAAPAPDVRTFYGQLQRIYTVAASLQLMPYRLQYTGIVSDSGGGGHFTLGGPTPRESPFLVAPTLLPRLVAYLNRHPSLSYWFATTAIGSSGQGMRPDEGPAQMFAELEVAFDVLRGHPTTDAALVARSLAPFLVDVSGNQHRAELNIEKIWNPALPNRGCLGLVEFRALGMAPASEAYAARACLLRALTTMLLHEDRGQQLLHWGDELQDRFALPFYLQRDLRVVLSDLRSAGLTLGEPIAEQLLSHSARVLGAVEWDGCRLEIEQALEFWPLVGDFASQEAGTSRVVDASTTRLQIMLRPLPATTVNVMSWELRVGPYLIPLRSESDESGLLRVLGLRYRNFAPRVGLHPLVPPRNRLELVLSRPGGSHFLRITVHEWRPNGQAYPSLPVSLADAEARRRERVVTEVVEATDPVPSLDLPASATTPYCLDLRRLPE